MKGMSLKVRINKKFLKSAKFLSKEQHLEIYRSCLKLCKDEHIRKNIEANNKIKNPPIKLTNK